MGRDGGEEGKEVKKNIELNENNLKIKQKPNSVNCKAKREDF